MKKSCASIWLFTKVTGIYPTVQNPKALLLCPNYLAANDTEPDYSTPHSTITIYLSRTLTLAYCLICVHVFCVAAGIAQSV